MDTRWRNRIYIAILIFLFTFGLSGLLALFNYGSNYMNRDYFHTPQFRSELDQFAGYLSLFELNELSLTEEKQKLTATKEDINEHRYRYGTLPEQVENIKAQYEERIVGAEAAGNQAAKDAFIAERDAKIEDITMNFASDEHVRPKVIAEKEQRLEDYFKARNGMRSNYIPYEESLSYYFKDTETGKIFTNTGESLTDRDKMLYVTEYEVSRDYLIHYGVPGYEDLAESFLSTKSGSFTGFIGVSKTLPSTNMFMESYYDYEQSQMILVIYSSAGLLGLLISLVAAKRSKAVTAEAERFKPLYNKLPIDVRVFFLSLAIAGTVLSLLFVNEQLYYTLWYSSSEGKDIVFFLAAASLFCGLVLFQWKYLAPQFKQWKNIKEQWKKGIIYSVWKASRRMLRKTLMNLEEAFLDKSIGTQFFLVLALIFGLGFAAVIVIIEPFLVIFYLLLLMVIGIPLINALVKRIGYFNRIIETTNELAAGKMEKDLQIIGKTALATLAGNINVLKQGVKSSQNAQAKSERLKTELITNVSHDLRTPLTSIITYTELLKKDGASLEEKNAYVEIIDRKSKRLKVLIDDLFEVSKMASGNIKLKKEKVDLVQLLQQALAEYDNNIKESSLHFRVTNLEKPVYANVDGQKLWRVFDNLIGNIVKYSLEQSRVYITIQTVNQQAMIIFKNVSKYELNDQSEELFERFKRGDTSRNTEGSGLGLAIAKSIIDLHEGSLEIETDGDLFKVTIVLKLE